MRATSAPPTLQQRLAERSRPHGPVVMHQRWERLLFLHWVWDPAEVQATLPPGLSVDTHEHAAWIGLAPLFMRDVRPRFAPPIPLMSDFLELNLRTYVYDAHGRPGIYFYSLDCDQPVAVEAARRFLRLRYEHATMHAEIGADEWITFEAQRQGAAEKATYRYNPNATATAAEAGEESLEFFLLERYRLFASDAAGEQLNSIRVCHPPYRFRPAPVLEWSGLPLRQAGFEPGERGPDHICATEPQDVEVFAPEKVDAV